MNLNSHEKILEIFRKKHPQISEEKISEMILEELDTDMSEKINDNITFVNLAFKPFFIILNGDQCIGRIWISEKLKKSYEDLKEKL